LSPLKKKKLPWSESERGESETALALSSAEEETAPGSRNLSLPLKEVSEDVSFMLHKEDERSTNLWKEQGL
jgi:hypothetical protein